MLRNQFFMTINNVRIHFIKNKGSNNGITITVFNGEGMNCFIERYLRAEGFLDNYVGEQLAFVYQED